MTALQRVRASLTAGERPSDDDVLAVCADAERYWLFRIHIGRGSEAFADIFIVSWSDAEGGSAPIVTGEALDDAIDAALADPALYTKDPSKARDLSAQREKAHAALHAAEHGWMEAAEAYELALAD